MLLATIGTTLYNAVTNAYYVGRSILRFGLEWLPTSLFSSGEQGTVFDLEDFSTLFQGTAGTTPVTAVEQPVGYQLDKSQGLVLGPELVTNGDFSGGTTGWSASAATISVSSGELLQTNTAGYGVSGQSFATVAGKSYKITMTGRRGTGAFFLLLARTSLTTGNLATSGNFTNTTNEQKSLIFTATGATSWVAVMGDATVGTTTYSDNISVKLLPGNHRKATNDANRPVLSARLNTYVGTEVLATQNVTTLATNYTLTFTGAGSITLSGTAVGVYTAGTYTITPTAGTLTSTVAGSVTKADLRPTNQAPSPDVPQYQRVNTATDYDSIGFPHYLKYNGINSTMQSVASIDYTGTDKMTVGVGVRKLSDAVAGMLQELSGNLNSNAGSYYITAPENAVNSYSAIIKGTSNTPAPIAIGYAAPITNTVMLTGDIATSTANLQINGVGSPTTSPANSGNLGNYVTYYGARAGTSTFFNGYEYSSTTIGRLLTAPESVDFEKWLNKKTGAY